MIEGLASSPRRGVTIALIGVDGSGKTTIARRLVGSLPMPAMYMYMGTNPEAASHELPTTRFKRAIRHRVAPSSQYQGGPPRRAADANLQPRSLASRLRSAGHVAGLMSEEIYRQVLVRRANRRGQTVIVDRHFLFDYFAHDVTDASGNRTLAQRVHGWLLRRLPRPEIVILLDAPANVVYARKREGRLEDLVSRRAEYLALVDSFPGIRMVDAARSLDEVEADVRSHVTAALTRP